MGRIALAALASLAMSGAAMAEGHGWSRLEGLRDAPRDLGQLFKAENLEFLGMVVVDGRVVSHWRLPGRVDDSQTDFLGNPLKLAPEMLRCYEEMNQDGVLVLDFCEMAD